MGIVHYSTLHGMNPLGINKQNQRQNDHLEVNQVKPIGTTTSRPTTVSNKGRAHLGPTTKQRTKSKSTETPIKINIEWAQPLGPPNDLSQTITFLRKTFDKMLQVQLVSWINHVQINYIKYTMRH